MQETKRREKSRRHNRDVCIQGVPMVFQINLSIISFMFINIYGNKYLTRGNLKIINFMGNRMQVFTIQI